MEPSVISATDYRTGDLLLQLPEPLTGKQVSLDEVAEGASAILVMFICNHCPFVVLLKEKVVEVCKSYADRGVAAVAISSNSIKTHPQDGPNHMSEDAKRLGESPSLCLKVSLFFSVEVLVIPLLAWKQQRQRRNGEAVHHYVCAGYPFPYLYDESQEVAKQYKAACTPEFYVFDSDRNLVYHGQFDGARPGKGVPVTGVSHQPLLPSMNRCYPT